MFSIGFTDEALEYPFDDTTIPAAPGGLILGGFREEFLANLSLWSKTDYELHWSHELGNLVSGSCKVALVVSYDDPEASQNFEVWRVYRDGDWAHFQNQICPYEHLPKGFNISDISRYIQDREVTTADGNRISEWKVSILDIKSFLSHSS